MKALLTICGIDYPYSHHLEELEKLLAGKGEQMPPVEYELQKLTPFAMKLRYMYGHPLTVEARAAMVSTVKELGKHVVERILTRERDGTAAGPDL